MRRGSLAREGEPRRCAAARWLQSESVCPDASDFRLFLRIYFVNLAKEIHDLKCLAEPRKHLASV